MLISIPGPISISGVNVNPRSTTLVNDYTVYKFAYFCCGVYKFGIILQ